jgi:hypothetical protein
VLSKLSIAMAALDLTAMALPAVAYSVGSDIVPGTADPAGSGRCYWKWLTGPNGNDIIDNALSSKPQVVQIDPSDTAFQTDSWHPWHKTDR